MKNIAVLILLLLSILIYGQNGYYRIDNENLIQLTTNPNLETYYPKLLTRYNAFDTTLTINDYRLIYYGFVLQDAYLGDYSEYERSEMSRLLELEEYMKLSLLCDSILRIIPISLMAHQYKIISLENLKNNSDLEFYQMRYNGLIDAILSSSNEPNILASYKALYTNDNLILLDFIGAGNWISHSSSIMTLTLKNTIIRENVSIYNYENKPEISINNSEIWSKRVKKRIRKIKKNDK